MRNSIFNKKSGRKGNLLATLLVVTASLLLSASAWAWDENNTVYFDNSQAQWTDVYHVIGKSDYSTYNTMTRVSGTQYLYTCKVNFDGASTHYFSSRIDADGSSLYSDIYKNFYKLGEKGDGTLTFKYNSAFTSNHVYPTNGLAEASQEYSSTTYKFQAYTWGTSYEKQDYTVTLTNGDGGTLVVKDYDDAAVASGSSKSVLTVLKITVTPSSGYKIESVTVGGTDKTAEAKAGEFTYTMTANTEVVVTYEETTVPTVFNAKAPVISNYEATLSGYLKYTGCEDIYENGFIYSSSEADMQTDTPTGTKISNTLSVKMTADTLFSKTSAYSNGTYYYRSYVKYNNGSADVYVYSTKDDIGSFVINGSCDITTRVVEIDKTSAVLTSGTAVATLSTATNATYYQWYEVSGKSVTFGNAGSKSTTATVTAVGDYEFKMRVKCNEGDDWSESTNTVSLHVCVAPTVQQLYLDESVANIICSGEKSTATIISQSGYDYTLRSETKNFGTLKGSGATLTWRNVDGTGTFTVTASETGTGYCASQMTPAVQELSAAKLVIDASSQTVNAYQPVTLSVNTEKSNIDSNPVWQITVGQAGYLLDTDTRMKYDSEHARAAVEFKGGATAQTTYTVKATADYTTGTKVCEATGTVDIEVSPATEDCK